MVSLSFFGPPQFALSDEDIPVAQPNQNIGLSLIIESLAGRLTLKVPIKLDKKMGSQRFFINGRKR